MTREQNKGAKIECYTRAFTKGLDAEGILQSPVAGNFRGNQYDYENPGPGLFVLNFPSEDAFSHLQPRSAALPLVGALSPGNMVVLR